MTATVEVHRCDVCDGPCLSYKGSEHGWTCRKCLEAYLQRGAARLAESLAAERADRAAARSAGARRCALDGSPVEQGGRCGGVDGYGPGAAAVFTDSPRRRPERASA